MIDAQTIRLPFSALPIVLASAYLNCRSYKEIEHRPESKCVDIRKVYVEPRSLRHPQPDHTLHRVYRCYVPVWIITQEQEFGIYMLVQECFNDIPSM